MMLKRAYFLVLGIIVMLTSLHGHTKESEQLDYTRYVNEVTSSFLKQVYKEYRFECGASGGSMPYDIEEISVQLVAFRSATIEQARELEILLTDKFTDIINAHEKIRPFLREYPFPSNRVSVAISFEKPKRKKNSPNEESVIFVFQAKDRVFYRAKNPDNPYVFKPILDESYETAREIVYKTAIKKPQLTNTKKH